MMVSSFPNLWSPSQVDAISAVVALSSTLLQSLPKATNAIFKIGITFILPERDDVVSGQQRGFGVADDSTRSLMSVKDPVLLAWG